MDQATERSTVGRGCWIMLTDPPSPEFAVPLLVDEVSRLDGLMAVAVHDPLSDSCGWFVLDSVDALTLL